MEKVRCPNTEMEIGSIKGCSKICCAFGPLIVIFPRICSNVQQDMFLSVSRSHNNRVMEVLFVDSIQLCSLIRLKKKILLLKVN